MSLREVQVRYRALDMKAYAKRYAEPDHAAQVVEPGTLVRDEATGELLAAHLDLTEDYPTDLLAAVRDIDFRSGARTGGLATTSRTFGFSPRIAIRRDFCHAALMGREHPAANAALTAWAARLSTMYAELEPKRYARQQRALAAVQACWRLPKSVFTSGIVNKDNRLAYHRDQGNFEDLWSFMVVLSRDLDGGMLAMPELGIRLRYSGAQLSAFDGARLIHGVTALRKRTQTAYRYSVVWYAMANLCNCGTPEQELQRIRLVKTQREERRRTK